MTDTKRGVRRMQVAAVQVSAEKGRLRKNLQKAEAMIEKAARDGAQLIILPECAAPGYAIEKSMWDLAETVDGQTVTWLTGLSKRLGVYVGIGLVEAEGEDFYNAYVLAGPDGKVAGRVWKKRTEFKIFRAGNTSRVIDTPLGRIGLGICADNHYVDMPLLMQAQSVDIMLMPHAWPVAQQTSKLVKEEDVREAQALVKGYAQLYTHMLGVPTIFANQTGPISGGWSGIIGRLMDPAIFSYAGYSTIADSDGAVKAQAGLEEGVIVGEVILDPSRKLKLRPKSYGEWLHPGAPLMRKIILPLGIASAKASYAMSGERKRKARQVSSSPR